MDCSVHRMATILLVNGVEANRFPICGMAIVLFFQEYEGCAIGKAKQNAKTELEQLKLKDLSVKELIKEAARMLV